MQVLGAAGNDIYCLAQVGITPGQTVVGTSVSGLRLEAGEGTSSAADGHRELSELTKVIQRSRLDALERMERAAREAGASGLLQGRVTTTQVAGHTCFTFEGSTARRADPGEGFFSCTARGAALFCMLDAGFQPTRIVMGNVVVSLGGRALVGRLSRGPLGGAIEELTQLIAGARAVAVQRMQAEAFELGASAVLDVRLYLHAYGEVAVELLAIGSACTHPGLAVEAPDQVITAHLAGHELWTLARMGLSPVQMVLGSSVHSIGWGQRPPPEARTQRAPTSPALGRRVEGASRRALQQLARDAAQLAAEQVVGQRMAQRQVGPGLVEYLAVGTAVRRLAGMGPRSPALPAQAVVEEPEVFHVQRLDPALAGLLSSPTAPRDARALALLAILAGLVALLSLLVERVAGPSP